MKKLFILIISLLITVGVIYYFGFYTYFSKTEIHEQLPTSSKQGSEMKNIATGNFGEVDLIHKGSGEAKLIEIDGKTILRFENFSVTSGPDLYVYLSDSPNPMNNLGDLGNYANLGLLKGTIGSQNYEVPDNAKNYRTAIIWCQKFGVLFSFALMK